MIKIGEKYRYLDKSLIASELRHIRGFIDDRVVYRVWSRRWQSWRYACEYRELFQKYVNDGILTKSRRI